MNKSNAGCALIAQSFARLRLCVGISARRIHALVYRLPKFNRFAHSVAGIYVLPVDSVYLFLFAQQSMDCAVCTHTKCCQPRPTNARTRFALQFISIDPLD